MGYEYYMNPPNAVKFSTIKTDIEKGLIPSLTPFSEIDVKPGEFYIDDSAGNVLYMNKNFGVLFGRTHYSNAEWKILQKLMRHYGFKVTIEGLAENMEGAVYDADDLEGDDNYIGSGQYNRVSEDYAKAFKEGVGVIPAPMPRDMSGEWGRKYRYIKYRETNGKVSRIQ
jgi:hypothetical protein